MGEDSLYIALGQLFQEYPGVCGNRSYLPAIMPFLGGLAEMANEVGKRYVCKKCGAEFIVTRGGKGTLCCCSQPMELKKAGGK